MTAELSYHREHHDKWLSVVLSDLTSFIQDHADCERRSSNTALGIVAKYPERHKINDDLIDFSINKLQRFQKVYRFMSEREIPLPREMSFDLYGKQLGWLIKNGKEERMMDRLLVAGIIEAREQQRLKLLHENLQDVALKEFCSSFLSEGNVYFDLCSEFFAGNGLSTRLNELVEKENEIFQNLELRPALH